MHACSLARPAGMYTPRAVNCRPETITASGNSVCRALILAAGRGQRMGVEGPPKALLRFGGNSLPARHLAILDACGVRQVTITIGYRAPDLRNEVARYERGGSVALIENPSFRDGSIVSLWHGRDVLRTGVPILLMDADVLYDRRLIMRLLDSPHENVFLLDRAIEPGEEPVKICIDNGHIVDFHKRPQLGHEWHGESVDFFRFSPGIAAELADRVEGYVMAGQLIWSTRSRSAIWSWRTKRAILASRTSAACRGSRSTSPRTCSEPKRWCCRT